MAKSPLDFHDPMTLIDKAVVKERKPQSVACRLRTVRARLARINGRAFADLSLHREPRPARSRGSMRRVKKLARRKERYGV